MQDFILATLKIQRNFVEYCVQELKNSATEEGKGKTSRSKQREGHRDCKILFNN